VPLALGMYHPLPFFIAKTASDTVNTLLLPCGYATVTYWAVGLRRTPEAYFTFLCAFALCILVAQSLGLALSCAIPNVQVSLIVAPMVILMLMILGGFYVRFSSIPRFIRWLSWCSQARYAFTAMVVNEFSGREFQCAAGPGG
jgi:ABC-type multidrug transport system permease subunit